MTLVVVPLDLSVVLSLDELVHIAGELIARHLFLLAEDGS